jgi:uncharacterized Zn-binding protein involved in type VI secretion
MPLLALLGAPCEAGGHPGECGTVASGALQDSDGDTSVTINGTPVATHGDSMSFGSHAHSYGGDPPVCKSFSSHELTPDQSHDLTVNGQPVMRAGDSTTDPRSGGTASITGSGGQSAVTHTE